jgi:hypothetical protein
MSDKTTKRKLDLVDGPSDNDANQETTEAKVKGGGTGKGNMSICRCTNDDDLSLP